MRRCKAIFACALLTTVIAAHAQRQSEEDVSRCSDTIVHRVGAHFRLKDFSYPLRSMYPSTENGGLIVAGVCKEWPANKSLTIAAFAYDSGVEFEKKLLLAVVDSPTGRVLSSHVGAIPEDAGSEVTSHSLRLDTAPYTLSNATRAFGLRLSTLRDRCTYDGGADDELTLFMVDERVIRPLFTAIMSHWRYDSGNRCGGEEVARTDAYTTISVEKTATHGFADLRFTAKRTDKKKPVSAIVKYDGQYYDLKPWRNAWGPWWE
jgi:hypothetical protein